MDREIKEVPYWLLLVINSEDTIEIRLQVFINIWLIDKGTVNRLEILNSVEQEIRKITNTVNQAVLLKVIAQQILILEST